MANTSCVTADAAGFADHQLERLGTLVLAQRGGLRKVEAALAADSVLRDQALALRIAIVFCHARRDPAPRESCGWRACRAAGCW